MAAIAVVVPLWTDSRRLDAEALVRTEAAATLVAWSEQHRDHHIVDQRIQSDSIALVIAGPTPPTDLDQLRTDLAGGADPAPEVRVIWVPSIDQRG